MEPARAHLTLMTALLSMERLFYVVVCHSPKTISKLSGYFTGFHDNEPEFIFMSVRIFKVIQAIAFFVWYTAQFGWRLIALPSSTTCTASFILLLGGQMLNALVWHRIGIDGVCYGVKFGRRIPWCREFPYSMLKDPQYVGAIMTVWGIFILASESAPNAWFAIPLIETALYALSMKLEY